MGGATAALWGMIETAMENASTALTTLEEAAAVFDGKEGNGKEAAAAEDTGVDCEAEEDD